MLTSSLFVLFASRSLQWIMGLQQQLCEALYNRQYFLFRVEGLQFFSSYIFPGCTHKAGFSYVVS